MGVETWFKFTRMGMHMTSESEEGSEREGNLFCFVGRRICMGLWFEYSTPEQKITRGKMEEGPYQTHVCCHCYGARNLAKNKTVCRREREKSDAGAAVSSHKYVMIVLACNEVPVAYTKSERKNQLKESNETKTKKRWAGGVSRAEKCVCDVQRVFGVKCFGLHLKFL